MHSRTLGLGVASSSTLGLTALAASLLISAAPSQAAVVLNTASRSVQGGVVSTSFGAFTDSQSGSGFASPNGTGSWSSMQTSSITNSTVSYLANYGASITSGGPQTTYGGGTVGFTFAFDITDAPQMISYSWRGWFQFAPTLTDPSMAHISLDTNGATMMRTLAVGHYSFSASDGISLFAQGLPAANIHSEGSISFIPAPGAGLGLLALCGCSGLTRRRRQS